MNKIFLSGNLTRDPEVRYTSSGKAMAKMGIAVQRPIKNAEGQYDVDFFNLTAWEKTAEFCSRYFRKGSRVFLEGRVQTYSYTGQDGVKCSGIDIQVENIEFGSSKRDDNSGASAGESNPAPRNNQPPAQNNSGNKNASDDFDKGDSFDEDEFIGDDIPDHKVPF